MVELVRDIPGHHAQGQLALPLAANAARGGVENMGLTHVGIGASPRRDLAACRQRATHLASHRAAHRPSVRLHAWTGVPCPVSNESCKEYSSQYFQIGRPRNIAKGRKIAGVRILKPPRPISPLALLFSQLKITTAIDTESDQSRSELIVFVQRNHDGIRATQS